MTGSKTAGANPYVGPRPFEVGETLYGRDREVQELSYRLGAERIVLLHSPSGAGKSSLIHAGLIPRLRGRFDVWRPTRVSHLSPVGVPAQTNRYALSTILGLEQGIPESRRRAAAELATTRLAAYVEGRPRRPGAPESVLLIIDQFEEILTIDPLAVEAKCDFFAQLGEALLSPNVFALFSLREDYLAPLDPYGQQVPTHFISRYRIDLLSLDAAREAIVQPSLPAGRTWDPAAAQRLLRDLATVKLQQADGTFIEQTGRHIEPMHLQVVCRGLWERMPPNDLIVDVEDIDAFGDVTGALGGYYAAEVQRIAAGDEGIERSVRAWIGDRLFTAEGIRTPVLRGAGASEGLDNVLIVRLVDAHLVRAEHRGGAIWYELAHDRLVKPVREDNTRWEQAHLRPIQIQAASWARQGRPAALLLSEEALAEAERWASAQPRPLAEPDRSFLAASREARAQGWALRTAQRRFGWAVASLGLAAVIAGAVVWQWQKTSVHNEQLATAKRDAEAAEADARKSEERARASEATAMQQAARVRDQRLLVVIATSAKDDPTTQAAFLREVEEPTNVPSWSQWIFELSAAPIAQAALADHVSEARFSPDGSRVLTVGDGKAQVWPADGRAEPVVLQWPEHSVQSAEFSADGSRVLALSGEGAGRVWRADGTVEPLVLQKVRSAQLSPDGSQVLTTSARWTVGLWRVDGTGEQLVLRQGQELTFHAKFSPDGSRVVTGSNDGTARVWRVDGQGAPLVLRGHKSEVTSVGFSPDGRRVVTTSEDRTARVWRADGPAAPLVLKGQWATATFSPDGSRVLLAAPDETARMSWIDGPGEHLSFEGPTTFSPDGSRVLTISGRGVEVRRADGRGEPVVLRYNGSATYRSATFSPDASLVLTTSGDDTQVWRANGLGRPLVLRGAGSAAFSPDGSRVLTTTVDWMARVWRVDGQGRPAVLKGQGGPFRSVRCSPDGGRILMISEERNVLVWRADGQDGPVVLKHAGDVQSAEFSADGSRVVTALEDGTAWVWQVDGPSKSAVLTGHESPLRLARFSPDGSQVVTASEDGTARVWQVDGQGRSVVLTGHEGPLRSAEFSPDGSQVVTASDDGTTRVWRADGEGSPLVLPAGGGDDPEPSSDESPASPGSEHRTGVLSAKFSPDGTRVLITSEGTTAQVRRVGGPGEPVVLKGHEGRITSAEFSPDGRQVLTASEDRTARLWPADGEGEPHVFRGHSSELGSAHFSADGRWIVTIARDERAMLWRASGRGEPLVVSGVTDAWFLPDSSRIATISGSFKKRGRRWASREQYEAMLVNKFGSVSEGKRWIAFELPLDFEVRNWTLPSEDDPSGLWRATSYCVPVEPRRKLLGETLEEAQAGLAACRAKVTEYAAQGAYR